jgi:hypothetical protein
MFILDSPDEKSRENMKVEFAAASLPQRLLLVIVFLCMSMFSALTCWHEASDDDMWHETVHAATGALPKLQEKFTVSPGQPENLSGTIV